MTETPRFGSGKRESHDASRFYDRFPASEPSTDERIADPKDVHTGWIAAGDARDMAAIPDRSVALVVTSPPYFTGREYEEVEGAPRSWGEYLALLYAVFGECRRVLEPGGRVAVNVTGLGRNPYRDLPGRVACLFDELGLLNRGQIIWLKADGAAGSCAWGSWRSPSNPVLRDVTERIVVASKGRMERAVFRSERAERGLPHEADISAEDFMRDTLDVWRMRPESAKRIGHPAPFPVELPKRLIRLYTYRDDLVLDPFIGSGTTAVAAKMLGRRYVGYDLDPSYVELAEARLAETVYEGRQL